MTSANSESTAQIRWSVYVLLIALAVGNLTGRLLAVDSVNRGELESHLIKRELGEFKRTMQSQSLSPEQQQLVLDEAKERISREVRLRRPFLSANDRSRWLAVRALVEQGTFAIDDLLDPRVWNTIDMVQHRGADGELRLYSSKPPLLITLLAAEYWLLNQVTRHDACHRALFLRATDAGFDQRTPTCTAVCNRCEVS